MQMKFILGPVKYSSFIVRTCLIKEVGQYIDLAMLAKSIKQTSTLSKDSSLKVVLSTRLPYCFATTNYNLGPYSIEAVSTVKFQALLDIFGILIVMQEDFISSQHSYQLECQNSTFKTMEFKSLTEGGNTIFSSTISSQV